MVDLVRLPDDVEAGARGGPSFNTSVITLGSGRENRGREWQVARHSWDIGYGIDTPSSFQAVIDFFYACGGRARSFLFKDWADYKGTLETVAAVVSQPTKRQLVKTYTNGIVSYVRVVDHPVAGTLLVYVDNMLTVAYTIVGGLITFTGGDPGDDVKATFEFDIPVRFDTDQLSLTMENIKSMQIPSIAILEVLGE